MPKAKRSKVAACVYRLLPSRLARRFTQDRDGSVAVEFAFVAIPFLALTFAIMESALVFFAGQTLESAVQDAARLIMTGQAQNGGWDANQFKQQVCQRMNGGLFDCANSLYIDVKTYNDFNSITNEPPPVTNGQVDPSKMNFSTGIPGSIEVVRFYYQWPIYVSLLSDNLATLSGNYRMLVATAVFCNEPYSTQSPASTCH